MTQPAYFYRAFGLLIQSEFIVAELDVAARGCPDLIVRRGRIDRPVPKLPVLRDSKFGGSEQYLGFATIGNYLIKGIDTVVFDPAPEFDVSLIGFTLLGAVMAVLMQMRGAFTLHASAVAMNGSAIIFMGDKTAGKSTTAGGMAAAGYTFLTDDVVAITDPAGDADVLPGYPMIKLTDAAIDAFGREQFELIPTNVDGFDKRRARLIAPFPNLPVRPAAAFVLQRGRAAAIEPLDAKDRFQCLMRFSYAARFGGELLKGRSAVGHMEHCAALSQRMLVARLVVPDNLEELLRLPDFLLDRMPLLSGAN
jgi:hypothetical protein